MRDRMLRTVEVLGLCNFFTMPDPKFLAFIEVLRGNHMILDLCKKTLTSDPKNNKFLGTGKYFSCIDPKQYIKMCKTRKKGIILAKFGFL